MLFPRGKEHIILLHKLILNSSIHGVGMSCGVSQIVEATIWKGTKVRRLKVYVTDLQAHRRSRREFCHTLWNLRWD